jgi:hypothetical protein
MILLAIGYAGSSGAHVDQPDRRLNPIHIKGLDWLRGAGFANA